MGQGQIGVSGLLARSSSIGGARALPALLSIPNELKKPNRRVSTPEIATVFSETGGPIGVLMSILVWVSSYL